MENENNALWGARIERGEVVGKHPDAQNAYLYDVKSIDRPGVVAYGLPCIVGEYARTVKVYFTLFEDGKGLILYHIV